MTDPIDRLALSQVIAIMNGKGGVGKTSLSTHLAGMIAARGERVLVVDLDAQCNTGHDLGYSAAGLGDGGVGLAQAVMYGYKPMVLRDVRPNLDVVPAGPALDDLTAVLVGRHANNPGDATLSLARALAPVAAEYSLVVLDCPPREVLLQRAALAAAAYVLIPTKTDQASLDGLSDVAQRFGEAQPWNPTLQLLGVVMFGVTSAAKKVRAGAVAWITEALDAQAPVFKASVRHVEAAAVLIRSRGQLAHELEIAAEEGVTAAMVKSVTGLASDYEAVAMEVFTELVRRQQRRQEAEQP